MTKFKLKMLDLLGFRESDKTHYIRMFTNDKEAHYAGDTITYLYDADDKKFLKVFNAKFEERINDRYFVLSGNSDRDEFYLKEFFVIDEVAGKVAFHSGKKDTFRLGADAGSSHFYIVYNINKSLKLTAINLLNEEDKSKDDFYNEVYKIGSSAALKRSDGKFDLVARSARGERGLSLFDDVKIVRTSYLKGEAVGIVTGSSGLKYLVDESGLFRNDMPYKELYGACVDDEIYLLGILQNGRMVSVNPHRGIQQSVSTEYISKKYDGKYFSKVNNLYLLIDENGNILRSGISKVYAEFDKVVLPNGEELYAATIEYDGLKMYLTLDGKIYNPNFKKWL